MRKSVFLFLLILVFVQGQILSRGKQEENSFKQPSTPPSSSPYSSHRPPMQSDTMDPPLSIDGISAASTTYYFEDRSLNPEELKAAISSLEGGALPFATVNADGSPNLAFLGPDIVDERTLMIGLSDNQTRENILERRYAVAAVYLYEDESPTALADSRGARLILEYIDDAEIVSRLKEKAGDPPDRVIFMRIVKILPVG